MHIVAFAGRGLLFRIDGPWRDEPVKARFMGRDLPVASVTPPGDRTFGGVGAIAFDWPAAGEGRFDLWFGRTQRTARLAIGTLSGSIDQVGAGRVTGWLARLGGRPEPPTAELLMDSAPIGVVLPSRPRPDIEAVSARGGHDGFQFPLPPEAFDGAEHRFQLFVDGEPLGAEATWRLDYGLRLDEGDALCGVCVDPHAPDRALDLALVANGAVLQTAKTNPTFENGRPPGAFRFRAPRPDGAFHIAPAAAPDRPLPLLEPRPATTGDRAATARPALFETPPSPSPPISSPQAPRTLIVVPVYAGREPVARCLDSVVAALDDRSDLVVVNDCSPDPEIWTDLRRRAAAEPRMRLIENSINLGFIRTVNSAFGAAEGRDVAIVNADAVVPRGWLERMRRRAYAAPNIASVTAMSNNATILGYPHTVVENETPSSKAAADLDSLFANECADLSVDLPTGVGFCMVLRADALAAVGAFDEAFDRGYGEEVDWCRRAAAGGWRHVAASDVFVSHLGSVSFGRAVRTQLMERNHAIVLKRHPDYDRSVRDFLERDPLRQARNRVDRARLTADPRPLVLHLTNPHGGGTRKFIADLAKAAATSGARSLILRPRTEKECETSSPEAPYVLEDAAGGLASILTIDGAIALLSDLTARQSFSTHFHSSVGWRLEDLKSVLDALSGAEHAFAATLHDYAAFCPRIRMVRAEGAFCGGPQPAACETCLATDGPDDDIAAEATGRGLAGWIGAHAEIMERADVVKAPSEATAAFHRIQFPELKITVAPHEDDARPPSIRPVPADKRPLSVSVLGALGAAKGYHLVKAAAAAIARDDLPIRLSVIGLTEDDDALMRALPGIAITGPYAPGDVPLLLDAFGTDIVLISSIWPETWSYTLSEAWAAGRPVAVLDIGAPAERVRAQGGGIVLAADVSGFGLVRTLLAHVDAGDLEAPPSFETPLRGSSG
ncbi:MAG: glycosyltransferase [Pseudomonadota bacterium]